MAQQIRYLYNELREPNPKITTQYLAQIVARTFDALDNQGPTVVNSTTNITNIVSGLWTQTGIRLYPTVLNSAVLVGMTNSDVAGLSQGYILSNAVIGVISSTTNASALFFSVNGTTETVIHSSFSGTGTTLPMSFYLNGIRRFTITTNGALLGGLLSSDAFVGSGDIASSTNIGMCTATTNASIFYLTIQSSLAQLVTSASGTGTTRPIAFVTSTAGEIARIRIGGSWLFGLTSSDVGDTKGWIVEEGVFGIVNATTNANALFLSVNGTTETIIHSSFSGTGTALPLSLYLSGVRYFTLQTSGALLGNIFTSDISPTAGMIVLTSAYFLVTTATNASTFQIHAGSSIFEFISSSTGTGTIVPIRFSFGGTEVMRITTVGQVLVGLASSDASNNLGNIYISNFFGILSATTNAHALFMSINGTTETVIHSSFSGAGTSLMMSFYVNGTRHVTITTGGSLFCGFTSSDQFGGHCIVGDAAAGVGIMTASTNASLMFMENVGSVMSLVSQASGTGTSLPMGFRVAGTEFMRITTVGQILVGLTSSDASNNAGNIYISNFFGILSATTNATALFLSINGTTETVIHSSFSGTGTGLPLSLYASGNRIATIVSTGQFMVGFLSAGDFNGSAGRIMASNDVVVATASTNAQFVRIIFTSGVGELESGRTGTGTFADLRFVTNATEQARITTSGTVLFGFASAADYTTTIGRIVASVDLIVATAGTNSAFIRMIFISSVAYIDVGTTGTGTILPFAFRMNGSEIARILTGGTWLLNLTSSDAANGIGNFYMKGIFGIVSATANANFLGFSINGTTETLVNSSFTGTGTALPFSIYVRAVRAMSFLVTNPVKVLIGSITDDGSGALLQVHGNISVNGTVLTVP